LLDKAIKKAFSKDTIQQRNKAIAKAISETNEELRKKKLSKAYNLGFPKFKKKSNYNDTICYSQFFKIDKNYIKLPKLEPIKYKQH